MRGSLRNSTGKQRVAKMPPIGLADVFPTTQNPKEAPVAIMLATLFATVFDRKTVLDLARETGSVKRLRSIHPHDLCLALIACAMGDEERSIASARRCFFETTSYMPEESSFYDRFTPEMVRLLSILARRALAQRDAAPREALAQLLGGVGIVDMLAFDATQGALPATAAETMPSTNDEHGGFKLTAMLSVLNQRIERITITDAKTHDRKALTLPRWLHGTLLLFDRGYSDHKLFQTIEKRGGLFITRLKKCSVPVVAAIRCGLGQVHVGAELRPDDLPCRGVVDLDADFRLSGGLTARFRVLRIRVAGPHRNGRREPIDVWLVTNIGADVFSAEQVATLYRMRWEVEVLFRTMKQVGRLDQLRSASPEVIHAFIYATVLGILLAEDICALMRKARPDVEPSPYRVAALVLGFLPRVPDLLRRRQLDSACTDFAHALHREGTNPNPGRPYAAVRYATQIAEAAA